MSAATQAHAAFDVAVRHRIALGHYSTSVVRKVLAQLNRLDADIVARLAAAGEDGANAARLEALLEGIRVVQAAGWAVVTTNLQGDLDGLAEVEAEFAARLTKLSSATAIPAQGIFSPVPPLTQIVAAVQARPFQGRFLRDWLNGTSEAAAAKVRDAIRQGFVEGRTTSEIVRSIRGTKALQYRDGIMEISRRSAETMVRTAITHTANVAHEEVYKANSDVILALIWTSVLDGRTSAVCRARSGKEFPIGKGPRPPAHPNCRSVMIPKVAPIPGVTPFEQPTYNEWLTRQSASAQDEILGPTRGRLFRSGGLDVQNFVDRKGMTLTIEQLRQKNIEAFARAGI